MILVLAALLAVLALSGCGGDTSNAGIVTVRGSTTLLPVVSAVASKFARTHSLVDFDVDMTGSQSGIDQFCAGLVPLAGSSRPLKEVERENCAASGVHFVSLLVAHDAVVLLTRTDPSLGCLTLSQIYAAAGAQARGVDTWEQVGAAPGSSPNGLPTGSFTLVGPGGQSGTLAVFEEQAIGPIAAQMGTEAGVRDDYVAVNAEQAIRNVMSTKPGSLGFVGYATAADWRDSVNPVAIDAGKGCRRPSVANLRSGSYPLSRDLYLFVNVDSAKQAPQVQAFVTTFLSPDGLKTADEVGSVSLSPAQGTLERDRWNRRIDGSGS